MEKTQKMIDYVKDYITDKVNEYVHNGEIYPAPEYMAYGLTSYDEMNGTILMDEELSFKTIMGWKDEAGAYVNHCDDEGVEPVNPFWRPGLFMVILVRFGIADIMKQLVGLGVLPEDAVRLDGHLAKTIAEGLEKISDFSFNW